jgi:tetratricopeptide (TPR) repeat protein
MAKKRRESSKGETGKGRERRIGPVGSVSGNAPVPIATRLTRRRLFAMLAGVVALAAAAVLTVIRPWGTGANDGGTLVPLPTPTVAFVDSSGIGSADFLGSEACASCHASEYATWRRSTHGRAGGIPGAVAVIARFNGEPIRFKDAEVIPASSGGTYTFTVRQQGKEPRVFRVDGVVGGGHMAGGGTQGFVSRMPDGTMRFLPFDFIRKEGVWFCNTEGRAGKAWQPITPSLSLADCGDWPPARVLGDELRFSNCQSCHGSQIDVALDSASLKYQTTLTSLSINCESCHGAGRKHVALVKDAKAVAAGNLAMRPLATLTKDGSLGVCWQCHSLKDRLRGGYVSGKEFNAYYATRTPQLGDRAHFADGRVRTFAYQEAHLWSDCYVNGGMTCTSCHDPHSQTYRDVTGTPLAGRFDNRQCTSCHQAKGAAPTVHTRHAATSAGSQCTSCHMPYLQEPETGTTLRYARSDHAIPVPRPAADSALGVVSACKSCHTDKSEQSLDQQVTSWWGKLKPRAPGIDAALRLASVTDRAEAARLVLDATQPHTAALFAGLSEFAERFLSPDMTDVEGDVLDRLDALGTHKDPDVRALALASLHYAAGTRSAVRKRLAVHLRSLGSDEPLVRSRWTVVLGFFADALRGKGDPNGGAATYRKAIEIEPNNPRLHLNLGVALAEAGDFTSAIPAYRASLALNRAQPLALVNLGIALAASGDKQGAMETYLAATRLNAREALAWFNLGNVYFEQSKLADAEESYRKAAEIDPTLSLAHFYLARALAKRGDLPRALKEVEAGLEFDPTNEEALGVRDQLRRAMSGGANP